MNPHIIIRCCLLLLLVMGCTSQTIEINVSYDKLSGLAKDDRVLFNHNEAGRVASIQYRQDQTYLVTLEIDRGFAHALTEYSRFYVIDDSGADNRKAIEIRVTQQGGVPLKSGAVVPGSRKIDDLADQLQKDVEAGFRFFKETIEGLERDIQQVPESEAYQRLKKSLQELADEIKQKEKHVREKIKREWLPKLERELDDLRRRLEESGREDELKPLEVEMERMRRI